MTYLFFLFRHSYTWTLCVFVVLLFASSFTLAQNKASLQKVIDFDDEVVEGMNKRPLDTLSQISEKNKNKKRPHLYRKRAGFRTEIQETLYELKFISMKGAI
ncbi:MAG: hypothetical protein HY843_05600 [Bdellovibrio sp.]|nr:hypothetical protein [Bdellovibrio sp.]